MRITEIVRVDSKGRITIPMLVRDSLNIVEGMHLVLIADTDRREIIVTPALSPEAKVYELRIEVQDVPGAFAHVSDLLAELGIDQVTTHCAAIKRGETAECLIVADFSQAKATPEEVREKLQVLDEVRMVTIKPLQRG